LKGKNKGKIIEIISSSVVAIMMVVKNQAGNE